MERDSGRSKGFGFVVLNSQDDVKDACDEMNGYVSFRYISGIPGSKLVSIFYSKPTLILVCLWIYLQL